MSSEERRSSIVEAAIKLFAEKGFRGTTTRELAAAVGVTEPILYEHFKTKRDLYAAIIESKAHAGREKISALSEKYALTEDDRGFFVELGDFIVELYMKDPTFIRLLLYSNLEGHELKELLQKRNIACFDIVGHYIDRRIRASAIRAVDPEVAARAYFGMIAHYAISGLVFGFAPFNRGPQEIVREMVDIFLNGLCGQEQ